MTKSYPVTKQTRAASLTAVMRREPPRLRLSKGMADAAREMERRHSDQQPDGQRRADSPR